MSYQSTRTVRNIKWAKFTNSPPTIARANKNYKGSPAKGKTYERAVCRYLTNEYPELIDHQWIVFEDENGPGHAQPDLLLITDSIVWIGEIKLTQRDKAFEQIELKYKPLITHLFPDREIRTFQVCKNVRGEGCLMDLSEVWEQSGATVHYLP